MNKPKVAILSKAHPILAEAFQKNGYKVDCFLKESKAEIISIINDYEGIITANRMPIDKEIIIAASKLKFIGRLGSGMEIIDVQYAKERNISCYSSPDGNANAVAEQALAFYLLLNQHLMRASTEVKNDLWRRGENRGNEIMGQTAGIIGYGHNGSLFAEKLNLLGVNVLAYDKYKTNYTSNNIIECASLNEIFQNAQMISFHVPLNDDTFHYFNDDFLSKMKHPFIFLNLSRGEVASQSTILKGINEKKIIAAGIDVWEQEPISSMNEQEYNIAKALLSKENVIGTPHIAGYTHESFYKMSYSLILQIFKK